LTLAWALSLYPVTGAVVALVAAIISALVSAATAVFVVNRQHALERNRASEAASITRLAEFLAAALAMSLDLGKLARAPLSHPVEKHALPGEVTDRFKTALATLRIAEPREVAAVAVELDDHFRELTDAARSRQWERDEWRARRSETAPLLAHFEQSARTAVNQLRGRRRS
jgi:hypothetical protein